MKTLKEYQYLISVLILALVAVVFLYWYQVKPSNIRKQCADFANIKIDTLKWEFDQSMYDRCIAENGLVK